MTRTTTKLAFFAAPLLLLACATDGANDGQADTGSASGGKYDDPSDAPDYCAEVACANRLGDAMARDFADRDYIRWQCGDVSGVTGPNGGDSTDCSQFNEGVQSGDFDTAVACHNHSSCQISDVAAWNAGNFKQTECLAVAAKDDRGQEYCEYFAMVDGSKIAPDAEDQYTNVDTFGRTTKQDNGAPYGYDFDNLTEDQLAWLEDEEDPDATVGACVFTSWHWDVTEPPRGPEMLEIFGVETSYENFRMFGQFNNNGAARKLVLDGMTSILKGMLGRREGGQPAAQHPYWAACMGMADEGAGVEWRVSDPTVGTVGAVLAECGCFAQLPDGTKITDPATIAGAVVPKDGLYSDGTLLRGFRLGTWNDRAGLPLGCKYVPYDENAETGQPNTQTLVQCDISAGDLASTTNSRELKEFCRQRYGEDVVVHVPLPGDIIKCEPPEGAPAYCETETPWSIDTLAPTVTLQPEDFPADSPCRVSTPGDDEDRGGDQLDDEEADTADTEG